MHLTKNRQLENFVNLLRRLNRAIEIKQHQNNSEAQHHTSRRINNFLLHYVNIVWTSRLHRMIEDIHARVIVNLRNFFLKNIRHPVRNLITSISIRIHH